MKENYLTALERAEYEPGHPPHFEWESSKYYFIVDDFQPAMSNAPTEGGWYPEDLYSEDMMTRTELTYQQWLKTIK